jgi:hypothetical protein
MRVRCPRHDGAMTTMTTRNDRYLLAAHRVQSAIAYLMNFPAYTAHHPKHLRVGIDTAKAEQGGLAKLLLDKGVFTPDEYEDAIASAMEREAERYAQEARAVGGLPDSVSFG